MPEARPDGGRRPTFMQRFLPAHPANRLALFLALLSLATLLLYRPAKDGDFQEYALMTIALANHASPDIRLADVAVADRLSPEPGFVALHERLRSGMQRAESMPFPGIVRGKEVGYYAIHFFGYSALAALPYKLIEIAGGQPFKAYQLVNLAALVILAVAMFRLTGSAGRTIFAIVFFMLSGGVLYANWASTEFFTACCLLAGLLFVLLGRPYAGALLAGAGAMQNPPLVFFSVFAPLIRICYVYAHERLSAAAAIRKVVNRHTVLASILQAAMALAPFLYNLAVFGIPSQIAAMSTSRDLITPARLLSFYFDLNQGVIIGFPVVLAMVAVQLVSKDGRRWLPHAFAAILFSLALALPSLSTINWNSGANGMMRYAFWGGMPLLYLALAWMQRVPRWPSVLLAAILLVQLGAMTHARSYVYIEFSPAARAMLRLFPTLYAPEPEIFMERVLHIDGAIHKYAVATYGLPGRPVKSVFDPGSEAAHIQLCGPGARVALPDGGPRFPGGWRYADGKPDCTHGPAPRDHP